jgi:hypothetical protein
MLIFLGIVYVCFHIIAMITKLNSYIETVLPTKLKTLLSGLLRKSMSTPHVEA